MLNIKKLEMNLEFMEKVNFAEDPHISFLKIIYSQIKRLTCITSIKKCNECSFNDSCVYYYLSSKDFRDIDSIPVIAKKPLFEKKNFKTGDKLALNFVFLGRSTLFIDFFVYIMREFELQGLFQEKSKFIIRNIKISVEKLPKNNKKIKGLMIHTPINTVEDIFKYEYEKLKKLNSIHQIFSNKINCIEASYNFTGKQFNLKKKIFFEGKGIKYKGRLGKLIFDNEIKLNDFLSLIRIIGLGNLFGLGGGSFEFIGNTVP